MGGFALGFGERLSTGGDMVDDLECKKVRRVCKVSLQKKVSIGIENFVLITVGSCGVSIGESLEQNRRVRAV